MQICVLAGRGAYAADVAAAAAQGSPVQLTGAMCGWVMPSELPPPGDTLWCDNVLHVTPSPRRPDVVETPPALDTVVFGTRPRLSGTLPLRRALRVMGGVLDAHGVVPCVADWEWGEALALALARAAPEHTDFILARTDALLRIAGADEATAARAHAARVTALARDGDGVALDSDLLTAALDRFMCPVDAVEVP